MVPMNDSRKDQSSPDENARDKDVQSNADTNARKNARDESQETNRVDANDQGSGTPDEAFRAAERMTAGPEFNDHGNKAYHAREFTGRHATEDWKAKRQDQNK